MTVTISHVTQSSYVSSIRRLTNSLRRARDTLVGKERDPNVTTGMTLFADKLPIHVAWQAWPRAFWDVTRKKAVKEWKNGNPVATGRKLPAVDTFFDRLSGLAQSVAATERLCVAVFLSWFVAAAILWQDRHTHTVYDQSIDQQIDRVRSDIYSSGVFGLVRARCFVFLCVPPRCRKWPQTLGLSERKDRKRPQEIIR